jgi:translation initiation factor IF-2
MGRAAVAALTAIGWFADVKHEINTKRDTPRERVRLRLPVETTRVRQALSRGQTHLVQVEIRRRAGARSNPELAAQQRPVSGRPTDRPVATRQAPVLDGGLTPAERQARQQALEQAREETARRAQQEAKASLRAAREAREGIEDARRRQALQATQDAAEDISRKRAEPKSAGEDDETGAQPDKSIKRYGKDRLGKLTVSRALQYAEGEERVRSLAALRRQREREKQLDAPASAPRAKVMREVPIPEAITVRELAKRMAEGSGDVVKALTKLGVMATIQPKPSMPTQPSWWFQTSGTRRCVHLGRIWRLPS